MTWLVLLLLLAGPALADEQLVPVVPPAITEDATYEWRIEYIRLQGAVLSRIAGVAVSLLPFDADGELAYPGEPLRLSYVGTPAQTMIAALNTRDLSAEGMRVVVFAKLAADGLIGSGSVVDVDCWPDPSAGSDCQAWRLNEPVLHESPTGDYQIESVTMILPDTRSDPTLETWAVPRVVGGGDCVRRGALNACRRIRMLTTTVESLLEVTRNDGEKTQRRLLLENMMEAGLMPVGQITGTPLQ